MNTDKKMKYVIKPIKKTFYLSETEFKRVEAFRFNKGIMFTHYDVADIAKECGFYERMFSWLKKTCKGCNFSNWDDTPPCVYDKENKAFILVGNKLVLEYI